MQVDLYQIDAFTDKIFGGNPAAVCPLMSWLPDETLQQIASENNLSETAFFIPSTKQGIDYELRWFTPADEVDLCGHATLATAYVIFNHINTDLETITFNSKSGPLTVTAQNNTLTMDFPIWTVQSCPNLPELNDALGQTPKALFKGKYWMALFETEQEIHTLTPDFAALKNINEIDFLIATSQSQQKDIDFISRFFCPKFGINEDPVTGSAHCITAPYWVNQLGKNTLNAYQASKRGGNVRCTVSENRVEISGQAILYMTGKIDI